MTSTILAQAQQQANDWSQYVAFKDYFFAFIGAVMGTLIGVWAARRQEATRTTQRRLALLQHLAATFRFNLDRLRQALAMFRGDPLQIPNYTLDDLPIVQILVAERDLITDRSLYDAVYWQRFQLQHINAKFGHLHANLAAQPPGAITPQFQQALASCVTHCTTTEAEISTLVGRLERLAQ